MRRKNLSLFLSRNKTNDQVGIKGNRICYIWGRFHRRSHRPGNPPLTAYAPFHSLKTLPYQTESIFTLILEQEIQEWSKFRRALRKEDQAVFDQLFEKARLHVEAGANASRPWPFETILISMLLEQEKELDGLRARIRTHENQGREACQPEGNWEQGLRENG